MVTLSAAASQPMRAMQCPWAMPLGKSDRLVAGGSHDDEAPLLERAVERLAHEIVLRLLRRHADVVGVAAEDVLQGQGAVAADEGVVVGLGDFVQVVVVFAVLTRRVLQHVEPVSVALVRRIGADLRVGRRLDREHVVGKVNCVEMVAFVGDEASQLVPISMEQGADRGQQPAIAAAPDGCCSSADALDIQRVRVGLDEGEGFLIRLVEVFCLWCWATSDSYSSMRSHRPGDGLLGLRVLFPPFIVASTAAASPRIFRRFTRRSSWSGVMAPVVPPHSFQCARRMVVNGVGLSALATPSTASTMPASSALRSVMLVVFLLSASLSPANRAAHGRARARSELRCHINHP